MRAAALRIGYSPPVTSDESEVQKVALGLCPRLHRLPQVKLEQVVTWLE